jgi:phosphohistidine swiveling domain-containing protein
MKCHVIRLNDRQLPISIGNKAKNLRWLQDKGFRIPKTFVCIWEAYQSYLQDDTQIVEQLVAELEEIIDPQKTYVVRSSANIEDDLECSFAGQFRSVLNLRGVKDILQGIWSIWATTKSVKVESYLNGVQGEGKNIKMGVIIQEMVPPFISGVAFSKNPITTFDEVVIEAVQGCGELLVQDGITPMRWVNKWGTWIEKPENSDEVPAYIEDVVRQVTLISRKFGSDVDLEWVYDGQDIYWLQVREITSIANTQFFSNKISKEQLPGLIKPLVWSVNVPVTNGQWVKLLTEIIGENDLDPNSLARAFYYQAYFDMGTFGEIFNLLGLPRESLEMMMGMIPPGSGKPPIKPSMTTFRLLPRLIKFLIDKWTIGDRIEDAIPNLRAQHLDFAEIPLDHPDETVLIEQLDRFYKLQEQTTYFNIVVPLLMQAYNGILKSRLKSIGVDYQRFDLTEGMSEMVAFDPNCKFAALNQQWQQIDEQTQEKILNQGYENLAEDPDLEAFRKAVDEVLTQFGHLSDSGNDFSYTRWCENPDLILHLVAKFEKPETRDDEKIRPSDLVLKGLKGRLTKIILDRARKFRLYREDISSMYIHGVSTFRKFYLALGDCLVARGLLASREDIFYLYDPEIRAFIHGETDGSEFNSLVKMRDQEMENSRNLILPEVIFGNAPPIMTAESREILRGTPTSRGYYTGPIKVVRGIRDFDKLVEGDVLVVPYSDVSWTPLFAKVCAVISESGGILSHCSIVAREYNIPAVVSVSGALLLKDHTMVTVDGYAGKVLVHEPEPE